MIDHPLVGNRLINVPLLLREEKCEAVVAALMDKLGLRKLEAIDATSIEAAQMRHASLFERANANDRHRPYDLIDGVAIIQIHGTLMQRASDFMAWLFDLSGYNLIEAQIEQAMDDSDVRAILLDVDSPGGEVAGCFDLARKIRSYSKRNGGKPIIGAVNEQACSAAYALISACDEIHMPETGTAGSIGVWTALVDLTRAFDQNGVNFTIIRAGDRKARGGPYEKADPATFAKLQDWIEQTRTQFATLVSDHRGMSVDDVLAQEGDWFHGDDTLKLGLVDGIGSFEAIFERACKLAA